jgi:hypothetical protein
VTDSDGRYILATQPGQYRIEVQKNGYEGFSEHLKNTDEDSSFINLYHGEVIKVDSESELNFNIPFDPLDVDISYVQIIRDKFNKIFRFILSLLGVSFSVISFVITPVWWVGSLVILQFLLYLIMYHFAYHKLSDSFGIISSEDNNNPLSNVAVRVFDADFNRLIETTVSDRKGRYAMLLGPSKYYVTYEKEKYKSKKSPLVDFSSQKTSGFGGMLTRDEFLQSS